MNEILAIVTIIAAAFAALKYRISSLEKQNQVLKEKDIVNETKSLSDDELSRRIHADLSKPE